MAFRYIDGFLTERTVFNRSGIEAFRRGCNQRPSVDVTKYWWPAIKHPARDEWALAVEQGDEGGLDAGERAALKTRATLNGDGWFAVVLA